MGRHSHSLKELTVCGGSKQYPIILIIININMLRAITQELSAVGKQSISSMKAEIILSFLLL